MPQGGSSLGFGRYLFSLGIVLVMGALASVVGAVMIAVGDSYWITMEWQHVPELALEYGLVKAAIEQNAWPPW